MSVKESGHEKSATPDQEKSEGQTPEEGKQARDDGAKPDGGGEPTIAELMARIAELENSKNRLESESKREKIKAQRLEKELQKATSSSQQKEEDWKSKFEKLHGYWMKSSIKGAVQAEAIKRGMINPERALNFIADAGLEFDEETGAVIGVENFFDSLQKSDPYLFKMKTPMPNGDSPGGKAPSKASYEEWRNLPASEMRKKLAEAMAAERGN